MQPSAATAYRVRGKREATAEAVLRGSRVKIWDGYRYRRRQGLPLTGFGFTSDERLPKRDAKAVAKGLTSPPDRTSHLPAGPPATLTDETATTEPLFLFTSRRLLQLSSRPLFPYHGSREGEEGGLQYRTAVHPHLRGGRGISTRKSDHGNRVLVMVRLFFTLTDKKRTRQEGRTATAPFIQSAIH